MIEDRYNQLLNSIDQGYCVIDVIFDDAGKAVDWRYLETNQQYINHGGLPDSAGQLVSVLYPGTESYWFEFYGNVAVSGKPARIENEQKKLGKWFEIYAYKIGGNESKRVGVLFRDVTDRKQTETALKQNEQRFRSVLDNSIDVIYRGNIQTGYIEYISPSIKNIMGYTPEQIMAISSDEALAMVHTDDLPALQTAMTRFSETGNVEAIYRQRAKSGEYRWISNHMTLTRDSAGQPLYRYGNIRDITEKRQVEDKLRESEERFRTVHDNSLDRFAILKPFRDGAGEIIDFTYVYQNVRAAKTAGRRSEEMTGHRMTDFFPTFSQTNFFAMYKKAAETRQPLEFEEEYNSDGLDEWFRATVTPIPDGIAVATQIITERKRTEEALQQANRNFTALFNNKTVGLSYCRTIFDENNQASDYFVLDVNPTYELMTGIPRNQIVGKKITEAAPGVSQDIINLHNDVAVTGEETRFEIYDSVTARWYDVNVFSPQRGYFIAVFFNITERRKTEDALRKSEEKYRLLFNSIDEGFCIIEMFFDEQENPIDYQMIDYNASYEKQTGLHDVKGKMVKEFIPELEEQWFKIYGQIALTGEPTRFTNETKALNRYYDVYAFKIGDLDSRKVAVLFNDITKRKRTEEALRESEQIALSLVEELEKADKNKNQFISVLSHELRNPLAVITASLSLLEIAKSNEQIVKTKDIIKRQTGQLTKLVDDLLELTRISQNKIRLKKEPVNLSSVVKAAALDHMPKYNAKGLLLRTELPQEPVFIKADPARIEQCIGNLLHNALKFTPKTGEVVLSLEREDNEAVISVRDNGMGISPDFMAHIFEPFAQEDDSLDRQNNDGLGLGLSITKGIAELHGGTAAVFSEGAGKGSLFTIRLPLTDLTDDAQNPGTVLKASRIYKILLIDDNENLTDVLCSLFGVMGHQAYAARNSTDGIKKAKKIRPDIIFCDIGLPGLSGYDVAKILKADDELKSAFLIALTGYTGSDEVERTKAAGFDRHLAKPVDMALLEKILAEIQ